MGYWGWRAGGLDGLWSWVRVGREIAVSGRGQVSFGSDGGSKLKGSQGPTCKEETNLIFEMRCRPAFDSHLKVSFCRQEKENFALKPG